MPGWWRTASHPLLAPRRHIRTLRILYAHAIRAQRTAAFGLRNPQAKHSITYILAVLWCVCVAQIK
jgi:hypothetical protein